MYLDVESCTSHNHFVYLASKLVHHLLADALLHLLADNGHVEQKAHRLVLNEGEYLLTYNFFHHHRHGKDDGRLDVGARLRDNRGAGHTVEEVDMAAVAELEEEFAEQAIHMCHGQNAQRVAVFGHMGAHFGQYPLQVAHQCPIRKHHALGESCCSAGVIDKSQLLRIVLMIAHIFLPEAFRIFMPVDGIQIFARVSKFV